MQAKPPERHHHGNLREALVEAGLELLNEGGLSAMTLRKCAARAGVSHAAPAHHFHGLEGLLTAVAAEGFRHLTSNMLRARESVGDDPARELEAICDGYLRFARENDALLGLMFSSTQIDFGDSDLKSASAEAYGVLSEGCSQIDGGKLDSTATEIMIWSLVHGFATISRKAEAGQGGHPAAGVKFRDVLNCLIGSSSDPN